MENKHRYFFILGMPRTRTAWLSVLLSHGDAFCAHEGIRNFKTFADYATWLKSQPQAAVGDADAALVHYTDELLEHFPGAEFIYVERDGDEVLESLIRTDPAREAEVRGWWPLQRDAWHRSRGVLESRSVPYMAIEAQEVDFMAGEIYTFCTGRQLTEAQLDHLAALRITTMAEAPFAVPAPVFPPVDLEAADAFGKMSVESLVAVGFALAGLTVRQVKAEDLPLVSKWWNAHHAGVGQLPLTLLPPLGVMISDDRGPVFALWCYEFYGVGVASLEYPVSRPGLGFKAAANAAAMAVLACMRMAGKLVEPMGDYRVFRCTTLRGISKTLERMGFQQSGAEWINMMYRNG